MENWKIEYFLTIVAGFFIGFAADHMIDWFISPFLGVIFVWVVIGSLEFKDYKKKLEEKDKRIEEKLKEKFKSFRG